LRLPGASDLLLQEALLLSVRPILLLVVLILPFTGAIAPRINGSKRFLFGTSLQPSELGKFAVVVWTAMLVVKKGDQLRRFSRGLMPFLVVLLALCLLAAIGLLVRRRR
jgi:cell division protein FtsW